MDTAKEALTWAKERVDRLVRRIANTGWGQRSRLLRGFRSLRRRAFPPEQADERTIRRMAEKEAGGMSSAESAERYARGINPGGTHGGKAVRPDGPQHQRPEREEPQAREERVPRGDNHMPEKRSGA